MSKIDSKSSLSVGTESPVLHRSGAVASILGMPVTTLRVWERRYRLTQSAVSPGGHRLYSPEDVQRLALIKRLTDLGHSIRQLAHLEMPQLARILSMHPTGQSDAQSTGPDHGEWPGELPRALRLAVIGASLGMRLQRPALLRRLDRPVDLIGTFSDVAQAAASLRGVVPDLLLIHAPQLHQGWLEAVESEAPSLAGVRKAILFGYASDPACEALATSGAALLREPQPDIVVAQWLNSLTARAVQPKADLTDTVPPRRWDDAAVAGFAELSSTVACECPRHVAELLLQLSQFEAYSGECEQRSPTDAELHGYLRQLAAVSRARFEAALEQVALHEGLTLPASRLPGQPWVPARPE